jgi:hypothetical protein
MELLITCANSIDIQSAIKGIRTSGYQVLVIRLPGYQANINEERFSLQS